jgi:Protein kinase domain
MKLCPKCGKRFSDDANFCPVDAARLMPIEEEAAADSLAARFDLRERLGGTRTGVVCRGVDNQTKSAVAVKTLAAGITSSAAAVQRIERELKQLERIQHAGIAKVLASGKHDEQTWVATELVEGARPLSEVVRSHGPLSPTQASEVVELIGEALIEAAQVGVVHHDLAPKNVLLAGADLKLINFSVPVLSSDSVPGVPEFVSPEQVEGKPVDQRSNIYSLGTLFYFALTGTTPFSGDLAAVHAGHLTGTVTPPSQRITISSELETVILRALERAPSKRFLTVRQFIDEVVRVSRGGETMRSTQPLGKAGKHKAELVQTLLGIPGDQLRAAAAAMGAPVERGAPPATAASGVSPELAAAPTQATPAFGAERSPWAPPATAAPAAMSAPGAMAEAQAAIAAVAPSLAAVVPAPVAVSPSGVEALPSAPAAAIVSDEVASPAVASPAVASPAASASSRRKKTEEPRTKGKFRETMWFKKGELDAAAAQAAAVERARTGKDVDRDKADSLPMDERYKDDGTLSHGDQDKYSLKTGGTHMMPALRDKPGMSGQVSEDELINEMKRGRGKYVLAIIAGVLAIGILVAIVALR